MPKNGAYFVLANHVGKEFFLCSALRCPMTLVWPPLCLAVRQTEDTKEKF